jgi:tetratricopeptide (TPR) repeat protein
MKIVFSIILLMAFLPSCRPVMVKEAPPLLMEEEDLKIKEWEEYMSLIGEGEAPVDTILRLTERYLDAKEAKHRKDMEEYERRLALYNSGIIKTAPREPVVDYSPIISYFRPLLPRYRYGRGADEIRYLLGYALYEQGERDEAVKVLEELVKNYPDSRYLIEVSFRLGEFYFETGRNREAIDSYGRILNYPKSIYYDKALYKLGWVYYKMDDFGKGIDAFMMVADRNWEAKPKGVFIDEVISSIVTGLSHFKDINEGVEYLKSKGQRGYAPLVLTELGDRLNEETRYEAALSVYGHLAGIFPDNPDLPFIYEKMAEIHESMGNDEAALEKRWMMVGECNPTTPWYRKNHPSGSERLDELISKTMVKVSKRFHYRGKKGADLKELGKAVEGYRMLLASYPTSPDSMEGSLLLAEALFDSKRYREAAVAYEKAASLCKEGEKRGGIAHSAFLTYEVIFYQSPEGREEVLRSAERVLETYRSDLTVSGRIEKVISSMAEMYSQAGALDKARESLMTLLKEKESIPTYRRVAEIYALEGNLDAAEGIYLKLVEVSRNPAFKENLAQIQYRIAEEHLKAGRDEEAARKFNQASASLPGSRVGEASLLKLGHIYIQRKEMGEFEGLVRRILTEYPGSVGVVSLLLEAGSGIEKEEPLKAAGLYEYASSITTNRDDSLKLMLAAAILYQENGDYGKAEVLFKRYIRDKDIPIRDEAEARYRLGYILLKTGRGREAVKTLEGIMELKGKVDDGTMARARLLIAEERQKAYLEAKLAQPFEKTLMKKTRLLNSLLKDYTDIARYGIIGLLPRIYFQMGTILENFRDSILEAERPKDLTEEEMKEYNFLLEERAYPYEEQAVKAYEMGLEVGKKQVVRDEWVDKSLERLIYLRPAIYKREPAETTPLDKKTEPKGMQE